MQSWIRSSVIGVLLVVLVGCTGEEEAMFASGESVSWDQLEEQWLVVNYWAEWCKPCYEEIPELNRLDGDARVRVLGVNYDGLAGEELRALAQRMGIEFAVLADNPADRFGWDQPLGLPATFVVRPGGEVVEVRFGKQTREALLAVIEDQELRNDPN